MRSLNNFFFIPLKDRNRNILKTLRLKRFLASENYINASSRAIY